VLNRPPAVAPDAASTSSSEADAVSAPKPHAYTTDLLEGHDGKKEQYDRRGRHKTKADKYDIKTSSKSRGTGEATTSKTKSSKRRRRKSGLALSTHFKAPNVAPDRLTLQVNGGPGMFHKGKTSSHVYTRGVPDLSFPDMTCLSKRQDDRDASCNVKNRRSSKNKNKEKDRTQQISEFFDRPPAANPSLGPRSETPRFGQGSVQKQPAPSVWSESGDRNMIEHRRAPPNHGVRRHSAPREGCGFPITQKLSIPDVGKPGVHDCRPRSTTASHCGQGEAQSTYYSWSVTPSRRGRSPKEPITNFVDESAKVLHLQSHHHDEEAPPANIKPSKIARHGYVERETAIESSVSQLSVDEYTKSTLLNFDTKLWDCFPVQQTATESCALSDLQHLARLEDLVASQRKKYAALDDNEQQSPSSRGHISHQDIRGNIPHEFLLGGERESSETARISSNHDPLLRPHVSLSTMPTMKNGVQVDQAFEPDDFEDSSRLRRSVLTTHKKPTLARPRSPFTEERPGKYLFLRDHQAARMSESGSSATVAQLVSRRRRSDDSSEKRAYRRSALNAAQQIIYDIEQEELLISGAHNNTVGAIEDDHAAAIESLLEQPSWSNRLDEHSLTHENEALHSEEEGVADEDNDDRIRHGDVVNDDSTAEPYLTYSPPDMGQHFGHLSKPTQPKYPRPTTPQFPATHHSMHLVQQQIQLDEDPNLAGFWRPHILY
jgi:hypothetical protein